MKRIALYGSFAWLLLLFIMMAGCGEAATDTLSFRVSGSAMEPGLVDGQHVTVDKGAYRSHGPERGDVIVFRNPQNPNEDLIKRVIGLPGETIRTDSTHLWVNDMLLDEKAYIKALPDTALNPSDRTWHIPPDHYFVLGDNRPISFDSRYFGFISKDDIVGKVT